MRKIFKNRVSVRDAESVLEIADTPAGIRITVKEEDRIVSGWFNPVQGAGISLAVLEAAGVAESSDEGVAAQYLRASIAKQERATAEAEAQAKLEAEALELLNAHREATGNPTVASWDGFTSATKSNWLAVTRKAREMRAEK